MNMTTMKLEDQYGVNLESGANDWQIFQQDDAGLATIPLASRSRGLPA